MRESGYGELSGKQSTFPTTDLQWTLEMWLIPSDQACTVTNLTCSSQLLVNICGPDFSRPFYLMIRPLMESAKIVDKLHRLTCIPNDRSKHYSRSYCSLRHWLIYTKGTLSWDPKFCCQLFVVQDTFQFGGRASRLYNHIFVVYLRRRLSSEKQTNRRWSNRLLRERFRLNHVVGRQVWRFLPLELYLIPLLCRSFVQERLHCRLEQRLSILAMGLLGLDGFEVDFKQVWLGAWSIVRHVSKENQATSLRSSSLWEAIPVR